MRKLLLSLLLCPTWIFGQAVTPTTISDTIVGPNGTNPSGTATIVWQRTLDANRNIIQAGSTTITITNGVVSTALVPNDTMLPPATCYQIRYSLNQGINNGNTVKYWYVPTSSSPVNLRQIEGSFPCAVQSGVIIAPAQITPGAAGVSQVITSDGTGLVKWAAGGGGGANPGGSNAQIQFNNNGAFGGFTLGGDCTLNRPNITCLSTNGIPFAASATVNALNGSNMNAGTVGVAFGGTGAGQFSQGSVVFAGASGVYQQNNSNLFWDNTNNRLLVGTNNAGPNPNPGLVVQSGNIELHVNTGQQAVWIYQQAGLNRFSWFAETDGNTLKLGRYDNTGPGTFIDAPMSVSRSTGDIGFGTPSGFLHDGNYQVDVQKSGSVGTLRLWDQFGAGVTTAVIQAGATQSTTPLTQFESNAGTVLSQIDSSGGFDTFSGITPKASLLQNTLNLSSDSLIQWRSTTSLSTGAYDTCVTRNAAGVIEVDNCTAGTYRDLIVRNLTINALAGGGTQAICVTNAGLVTVSGCPGGGGSGTVTNTGTLTAGAIIVGTGGVNVSALGSLGTTTQVLHGNAGGNPSFSAVSLTADVSGILPFSNGGTGLNSNFTNHQFFGNNSGSTAAPTATQPTYADLAAGTATARGTFPGGDLFIGGIDAQTGTSYTVLAADENKLLTFNNGASTAVTLPQATTAGFTAGAEFHIFNIGAGVVTITPTTSTVNGGATAVLNQNQGAFIVSDGTNYSAWISAAPTGSGTVTSIATTSPITGGTITSTGTIACATCVTSAAALTSNQLVIGGGSQASAALGTLGTTTTLLHGNAGGAPTFGAVTLTTDVTGTLPFANGGTGLNTNFGNHVFFGNNSGSTAAPVATQPTFADLATGTATGVATFPGGDWFMGGVNAQSGTTYTVLSSDENKLLTFNNSGAVAVSLPQATGAGFTSGAVFNVFNRGAGAVTITPTTSTINGAATLVLAQNQGATIVSDGTNYSIGGSGGGGGLSSPSRSLVQSTATVITMLPGTVWTASGNTVFASSATITQTAGTDTGLFTVGYNSSGQRVCYYGAGITIGNYTVSSGFQGSTCTSGVPSSGVYTAGTVQETGGSFGAPTDFRADATAIALTCGTNLVAVGGGGCAVDPTSTLTWTGSANFNAGISTVVTNPAIINDPNDHRAWNLQVTTDGTTTNPTFDQDNALEIDLTATMGQALYGGGTNAKKTMQAELLSGTYIGSGQKILKSGTVICYSLSDCASDSTSVTFAGGPIAGDEAQGMNVVSYLKQQNHLTKTTISTVSKSTCNTTTSQTITASKTAQTVTVVSTAGCNVNDWVTIGREAATSTPNSTSLKLTAVGAGSITGVFVANYSSGVTVTGATVLTVASTSEFGQDRVLVDLTATPYTTGTVSSISGAGFAGSGTTWTNSMVGGDSINPGCIALTNDQFTSSPFGAGANALNSWYQINTVVNNVSLGIYSTSAGGDAAYHGNGVGSGAYTIRPCAIVHFLPGSNTAVLEANNFTWTVNDSVEMAIVPYPDVSGFQYQTQVFTPGGIRRAWYLVTNTGPTSFADGLLFTSNGTTQAWDTGAEFDQTGTGVVVSGARTGSSFVAKGTTDTTAAQTPCYAFTGVNLGGGRASPNQSGMCNNTNASVDTLYLNSNNVHVITLAAGVAQFSTLVDANGTIPTCNSAAEGSTQPFKNSNTNTWGATIAGSGSNHVLGYCDGTNWTVMAK